MATLPLTLGSAPALPPFRRRRQHRAWQRIGSRPTLDDALAVLPSLPRPLLNRLVANLIEHLDEKDGDPDWECDDPAELDDHWGVEATR